MIMLFGEAATWWETKSPEWLNEMHQFMMKTDQALRDSGEYVDGRALADGQTAKTVVIKDGTPVPTDGRSLNRRSPSSVSGSSMSTAKPGRSRSPQRSWPSLNGPSKCGRSCPHQRRFEDREPDRGSAARFGAAGPRCPGATARAVRPVRGGRPGVDAGRRPAMG